MRVWSKARAIVALAAAYAVALQAMLLAMDGGPMAGTMAGPMAGIGGFAALCSSAQGAKPHSVPAQGGHGGMTGCLGCCCCAPVAPAAGTAVIPSQRATVHRIPVNFAVAPAQSLRVASAHRARAPPLG
jgi:hypothetical protein